MERKEAFSSIQGGFRRDRSTFAKIWTLRNIIEFLIINNKELHMCYIDIQKAYDSVEYWALDIILEKYGFSSKFISIIQDICINAIYNVILPYSLSKDIKISKRVKQRCLLSLMLFIIFLEPLMLLLEEFNKEYNLEDRLNSIPKKTYTDDIVLYANTNKEL